MSADTDEFIRANEAASDAVVQAMLKARDFYYLSLDASLSKREVERHMEDYLGSVVMRAYRAAMATFEMHNNYEEK